MPGAPNRPPSSTPEEPAAVPTDQAARAVLRRLGPSRVALRLDLWKGAPSPELVTPYDRAEQAFAKGDINGASGFLDQLSVRFAEPRWPTLPLPFRELRVSIPAPMPPQWDPDHALGAPEKEAKRLRRDGEKQLAFAKATIAWMETHGLAADDLPPMVSAAEAAFASEGPSPAVWENLDRLWTIVRARVPAPQPAGARPAPPPDAA